ncbi:MAG: substrate-binding domain-containing protein [Chitinophagaceae bacterium]|nr:substrate-binding domain-containing protein [Chitinophagaceae bacterium]
MNSYKVRNMIFRLAVFLSVCLMTAACSNEAKQAGPPDTLTSGTIQISADESFRPVIEEQIKVFEGSYPSTKINAVYKPEADCLKDLFRDSATRMVIVTRGLTPQEARYFDDTLHYVPRSEKIASDAIAVVVNSRSNDTVFSLQQLQQLLTGGVSNKKVVFDGLNATSTIRFAMDSILKGKKFDNNRVQAVKNSKEVLDYVASDENAIGFVGISWIGNPEDTAQVNMLRKVKIAYVKCELCVDSPYIKPTQAGIMTRRYPLVRGLYYILKENYSGLGSGLAGFLQYERGQLIFRRAYLQPGRMSFNVRNVIVNEKLKKE